MSESGTPNSSSPSKSQESGPAAPSGPSVEAGAVVPVVPPDPDAEGEWTVGDDGVVDEPSDHSQPSFDDDLDPTDAP